MILFKYKYSEVVQMRVLISIMLGSILMSSSLAYAEDAATAVARAGVSAAFDEAEKQIIYRYFKDYVKEKDDYAHEHEYDEHKSKHKKNKKDYRQALLRNWKEEAHCLQV